MYTLEFSSELENHGDPLIVVACDVSSLYTWQGSVQTAFAARRPVCRRAKLMTPPDSKLPLLGLNPSDVDMVERANSYRFDPVWTQAAVPLVETQNTCCDPMMELARAYILSERA